MYTDTEMPFKTNLFEYNSINTLDYTSQILCLTDVTIYKIIKNFDDDPITIEEEKDLLSSCIDYATGNFISFSSDDSREKIMKFLDDL
jgi:hypothetical protein